MAFIVGSDYSKKAAAEREAAREAARDAEKAALHIRVNGVDVNLAGPEISGANASAQNSVDATVPVPSADPPAPLEPASQPPAPAPVVQQSPPSPPKNTIVGKWKLHESLGDTYLTFGDDGHYSIRNIWGLTTNGQYIFGNNGTLRMQDYGIFTHETTIWHCQVLGDKLSVLEGDSGAPHMYNRIE